MNKQRILVENSIADELRIAFPGIDLEPAEARRYIRKAADARFDGLLKKMLRKQEFLRIYFAHCVPPVMSNLGSKVTEAKLLRALSEIALDDMGSLVLGDAFGLKRANDLGGYIGGDSMLKYMETAIAGEFDYYGRLSIGDEFICYKSGPSQNAIDAANRVNDTVSSHLVGGLSSRVDFGIVGHYEVAGAYHKLITEGIDLSDAPRKPSQRFYDIALEIAEVRSRIIKAYELCVILVNSLRYVVSNENGRYKLADHEKLQAQLIERKQDSVVPKPGWLEMDDLSLSRYMLELVIHNLKKKLPKDPKNRIISNIAISHFKL